MTSFSTVPRHTIQRNANPGGSPPPTRWRRTTSRPNSRFSTPVRVSRASREPTAMDVDETQELFDRIAKTDAIFAKSNEMQVSFYAQLPEEVTRILRNASFYSEAYTGDVDTATGFALVSSAKTCFVWKYSQALAGTPTCYIFGCPLDQTSFALTTPFYALVPYGPTREPGLILMTPGGQIRFWQSLASGLAGGEHWIPAWLDLQEHEQVTTLTRADPQTYVVSTSIGRLFRLTLTSSGGKYHLSPKCFARPQSSLALSRLLPTFFANGNNSQLPYESGNINAIALDERSVASTDRRDVWALIDYRIQRWNMSAEGWEELELDEDVSDHVRPELRKNFDNTPKNDAELDLEFLDLKLLEERELLLLVSYAGQEEFPNATEISQAPRRIYALLQISLTGGSFAINSVRSVPYQSTSSSGAPMHPRMQLIIHSSLVTVQFGDTVTICSRENEYMDRLELKSTSDRTLGVGVIESENSFLVLTAATLMKTYVDPDAVGQFDPERGKANLIQSTMTQAILYGSHKDNPLHFSFPPEVNEDALMKGAEQLSRAILESSSKVVRPNLDLSAQITHRRERLQFLIEFINENAVLTKMSQRCRQRLLQDAENLQAAHDLWQIYNQSLSAGNARNVLSEAIFRYMNEIRDESHEDYMRAFFRLRTGDIGNILPRVITVLHGSTHDLTSSFVDAVPQANRILLTILDSAIRCREENYGLYGISPPLISPWTSLPAIIEIINELFDNTARLIEQPSSEAEQPAGRVQAKEQLPQLAAALFQAYYERLEYLRSPVAVNEARERSTLEDRFRHSRPEILETLRRNGFADQAFELAEDYRDFRSLALLCNKGTIYPPSNNPNTERIQQYLETFKEDFANELFQWYIEHGELRTMFAQESDVYLDRFFAEHDYPNISWIHQLNKENYALTSETLLDQADSAPELSSKQLMLSIGKLSYLAQLHEEIPPAINEDVLNTFHDGLDFISVHETLIESLRSSLQDVRTKQSLEQQVDIILRKQAASLAGRRSFYTIFKQLVRRLLQGKALSIEEAADVLSMKDNTDRLEDYVTAFHLLSTAKYLPQGRRQSALRSVWRRIYLHDDWNQIRQTANVPDAEINGRLRRTALYAALQMTTRGINSIILDPAQTQVIPSLEELQSRWQGAPIEEIADIRRDYESDAREIEALALEDVFARVRELVVEDLDMM